MSNRDWGNDPLSEALKENNNKIKSVPEPSAAEVKKVTQAEGFTSREQIETKDPGRPRKREKTSNIPFSPPSVRFKKDFKMIALKKDKTMQDIFDESLTLWFKKEGLDYTQYFDF